jgi:two-component system sensor histidine kinase KdpD
MAPGVGKTHAMLAEALREKRAGRDVVIGCIENRGYDETDVLTKGLEVVPRMRAGSEGGEDAEMDVAALLLRRPELVIIDELAHSNVPGLRHPKRYQDVIELLEAGIEVHTTLNVQNLASRADTVQRITGARIGDTVPDGVLDGAEIELIDLSPEKLIRRFREGKACLPKSTGLAHSQYFREGNLAALREMALRAAAEHAGQDVSHYMQSRRIEGPWKSGHRLLVGVGPGAVSEQIVRWSRRLADSLNCPWLAVYVETSRSLAKSEQPGVTRNLALAGELGAEVLTTTDEDIVRGLLRVSARRNVTQIVVGKPLARPLWKFLRGEMILRKLVRDSGDIDIHIVRTAAEVPPRRLPPWVNWRGSPRRQYLAALAVVTLVTIMAAFLQPLVGVHSTALIFLLAVVLLAMFVGRGPTLVAATLSAVVWDYYFLPPVFEFRVTNFEDGMLLFLYIVVALEAERQREARATALHQLAQGLNEAGNLDQMLQKVVEQAGVAFKAAVAVFLANDGAQALQQPHPTATFKPSEKEASVAVWVLAHHQSAGRFTDNLPAAECLYLPLAAGGRALGVIALRLAQPDPPTVHQRNLLDAFCQQVALALDRHRLHEEAQDTRLLAESERLGKTLLDSMSHEIRTPLAAIQSAVGNLVESSPAGPASEQRAMVSEIQEATERLNRLVGNVLDMTRLESGHVKPKLNLCDVADLVHVAAKEAGNDLARHRLGVEIAPDLPLVRLDYVLMQQALTNLLSNAAFHTSPETPVRISAQLEGNTLVLAVDDRGPGIPSDCLPRIFDKFFRAPNARTGGTGLGLSLVKGFVEAQGAKVTARLNPGGGLLFRISLPLNETNSAVVQTQLGTA